MRLRGRRLIAAVLAAGTVLALAVTHTPAADANELPADPALDVRPRAVDISDYPNVTLTLELRGVAFGTDTRVEVIEDGVSRAVAAVEWVAGDQDHAIDVVVVIDTSGSMRGEPIAAARAGAAELIARLSDDSRVAVMEFSSQPQLLIPLSHDHRAARSAIEGLQAGGRTALNDAILAAVEHLGNAPPSPDQLTPGAGRRSSMIVVLADGEDNASAADEATMLAAVAAADVTIHAVELRTSVADLASLTRIAQAATDGSVTTAWHPDDLRAVFNQIEVATQPRVRITYASQASGQTVIAVHAVAAGMRATVPQWRIALPDADRSGGLSAGPLGIDPLPDSRPSGWLLVGGWLLALVALGSMVVAAVPATPRLGRDRLGVTHPAGVAGMIDRVVGAAQHNLERQGRFSGLAKTLSEAGIVMAPSRFVVNSGAGIVLAAMAGFVLSGALLAVGGAALTTLIIRWVLRVRTARRRAAFADQLDDTLQLLAGSLRAGHSLMQSIDTVSREAHAPTCDEFRRIISATRLGQDLSGAFDDVVARTGSPDLDWVAQAIAIHREVGGNLAGVLDAVASTIRERNQIRRQVKAISAEGRLSAIVLISLPLGLTAFLAVTSPDHLRAFTSSLVGLAMLGVAGLLLVVGGLWLKAVVKVKF